MPTKAQLISTLQMAQDEILRLANDLTEAERSQSGPAENWGPRDILAHLGEGKRAWAADLATARRGETPERGPRPDRSNEAIYAAYRDRPWEDFAALLAGGHQELIEQVQGFSEEELNDPQRFAWTNGSPLWRTTAGLCFVHPTTHLFQAHLARGDRESAARMARFEREQALALDASDRWQGMEWYNQGCYQALLGNKEQALQDLELGLRRAPQYIQFAREDTDLVALHADPDFQALLERLS